MHNPEVKITAARELRNLSQIAVEVVNKQDSPSPKGIMTRTYTGDVQKASGFRHRKERKKRKRTVMSIRGTFVDIDYYVNRPLGEEKYRTHAS